MAAPDQCESCGRREVKNLIYFNDGGPTFAVCGSCAVTAGHNGCSVLELDGQYLLELGQ